MTRALVGAVCTSLFLIAAACVQDQAGTVDVGEEKETYTPLRESSGQEDDEAGQRERIVLDRVVKQHSLLELLREQAILLRIYARDGVDSPTARSRIEGALDQLFAMSLRFDQVIERIDAIPAGRMTRVDQVAIMREQDAITTQLRRVQDDLVAISRMLGLES